MSIWKIWLFKNFTSMGHPIFFYWCGHQSWLCMIMGPTRPKSLLQAHGLFSLPHEHLLQRCHHFRIDWSLGRRKEYCSCGSLRIRMCWWHYPGHQRLGSGLAYDRVFNSYNLEHSGAEGSSVLLYALSHLKAKHYRNRIKKGYITFYFKINLRKIKCKHTHTKKLTNAYEENKDDVWKNYLIVLGLSNKCFFKRMNEYERSSIIFLNMQWHL